MNRRGKPTVQQRAILAAHGLDPKDYIVISCDDKKMRIAHRGDGGIRKIKIETPAGGAARESR